MMQLSREERLIQLENMSNTRDLGGYETQDGKYTKTQVFVRAASPANATENDLQTLYDYGVRCVIDLRSEYELQQQPSKLDGYKNIEYYNIPLMANVDMSVLPDDIKNYQDLSGFYMCLIEANKEQFKKVFKIIIEHPYQTILFNCSAGKDRTGVIAGLLLDLVGCHEYDIVKDYSESYENNLAILSELEKMISSENQAFLGSNPTYMIKFIGYLREHYGSAKEYLISCGMDEDEINDIIENFKL